VPDNVYLLSQRERHGARSAAVQRLGKDVLGMGAQQLWPGGAKSRLLGTEDGLASQRWLASTQSCCRTAVLPLYGSGHAGGAGFPALSPGNKLAQDVRDFVANGNVLVLVGGTMARLFLNRYFGMRVAEADGGYSRGPWFRALPPPAAAPGRASEDWAAFARCPARLPQGDGGDAVPLAIKSLPVGSVVIYGDASTATVAHVPYCERLAAAGPPQPEQPDRCRPAARRLGQCSCGETEDRRGS